MTEAIRVAARTVVIILITIAGVRVVVQVGIDPDGIPRCNVGFAHVRMVYEDWMIVTNIMIDGSDLDQASRNQPIEMRQEVFHEIAQAFAQLISLFP